VIAERPDVLLLQWIDPPANAGHWTPELIEIAGGHESIGVAGERWSTTLWETILEADPDVMVIACCGFDIERNWEMLRCVQSDRVYCLTVRLTSVAPARGWWTVSRSWPTRCIRQSTRFGRDFRSLAA
jgi:ABC-type Fe3+-hydroxamate transport system substrate-binding protein